MAEHLNQYPPGWDRKRVMDVLQRYETQTEEEAVAEDEAAFATPAETAMVVPVDLVPADRDPD